MCIKCSSNEAMAAQVFSALYTHQKNKKAKVWQDGTLKASGGGQQIYPGDELESDRYLITVEAVADSTSSTESSTENVQNFNRGSLKPIGLRPPAGLKRKFTGFHGPREMTKKPSLEVEDTPTLSSPHRAHGCSSLSPQLYATSPLFAAPYGKQADTIKQINFSSKHAIVTQTDLDVRENILHSNFSASPECTVTSGNVGRVVEGERTKQNLRSTAQILALLNTLPSQTGSVADHLPAEVSTVCNKEIQKNACTLGGTKPCKLPNDELSPVRTKPVKSRWDVYLETPPASSTSQTVHDHVIVTPDKRLDISFNNCILDNGTRPDEVKVFDKKTGIIVNKQLENSHISEPGPTNSLSPTPEILSVSQQVDANKFITDDERNDGAFSEVTFNLIDSFDFTELDDSDSIESQPFPETAEKQDFLQTKSQEKYVKELFKYDHTENTLHHETNYTDCAITTISELSYSIAKSKSTIQTLLKDQSRMDKTGDDDNKAEVMIEANVIQTGGKGEFLFPNKAKEDHIPSRPIAFQSDDISKQNALPRYVDDSFGYLKDKSPSLLPDANIYHSVEGCNEDCNSPELWPSGGSISLLKSLTEPSNALESLNVFSAMSIPKNDGQTDLERVEDQALHRLSQREVPLAASEDYQATHLFVAEPPFSPALTTPYSPVPVSQHLTTQPVEFQGHRVKGSATSAVMIRHNNPEPDCTTSPQYTESTSSFVPPSTCILGDIIPVSPNTAQVDTFFKSNVYSPSGSGHSPALHDVTSMQNRLPRWIVGIPGSDCDWELSQWSSSESNKVKTLIQENRSENVRPFFLRPRQSNVADDSTVQSHTSTASLEQNYFLGSNKISKVQSSFMKEMTGVSISDDEVDDAACSRTLKPSSFLLRNGRSVVSPKMPSSKWAEYQSISPGSSQNVNKEDRDFSPQSVFRRPNGTDEILNNDMEPTSRSHLGSLKDRLGYHNCKDTVSEVQIPHTILHPSDRILPLVRIKSLHSRDREDEQILLSCELGFPCRETVLSSSVPKRKVNIPAFFTSAAHYKQVFSACLAEHLNIIMYELSQRLHKAFSKVDMSFYTSSGDETHRKDSAAPFCLHQQPAKLVMVRKEGPNKGRFFYTCDSPKATQCKFFKWLDEVKGTHTQKDKHESRVAIADMKSLSSYIRCQSINLYAESQLNIRKVSNFPKRKSGKFTQFSSVDSEFGGESKTKLYLKLSRKDSSSAYSKDDLWVVSKTLNFGLLDTFIAGSVFYGPSANNDIEISPLKGYSPSNWPSNMVVHALLVCNASTELTSLRNIQEHFNPSSLPIIPHLLTMSSESEKPIKNPRGKFKPPTITAKVSSKFHFADHSFVLNLAMEMITPFSLNEDQATALLQIAHMMASSDGFQGLQPAPITIIHGVFGAGKSYLLAVVILFLVQLFETHNPPEEHGSFHWKLLISSSTNVAVDRVLLGLLDLGFDRFIRVGSIRKIAKPILPHSLHSGSENESEQLKELQALLKEDLTPGEKAYVRKSIELHKLGTNKTLLGQVRVVGATCAACPFPCLSNLKFPVVVLDECSQMTEPASLLPIARFQCEKLILVGDPKQLSPTIQGSDANHAYGLEQTLFNRLCLMGHQAVMLKTQYRCHPSISAVVNELFYEGQLLDGVSHEDRKPLLDWLPTLCFYNANGIEKVEGNSSFCNVEEASFTVKLIQSLVASGIQGSMIGVITLYKSQMNKICSMLSSAAVCDPSNMKAIQVSTVDAFQGAEKEIIILSCVRTRQVGFIDSEKRMNVALTRGKRHLLIVGSLACLRKNKLWEQVIHHCEKHKDGLNHISQWDERLSAILALYQERKEEEEASSTQRKHIRTKSGKT
ncbi:5'-3' DNA helicase ZGRF1 isoform X2 [Rhinoderma darwinii]|uniref:5'-3' DNA helicase ZGRF1 isoform X2 n=1 Tax=Rhinoderma darwinii TaxID=43563 RepID=UPI003F671DEF